MEKFVNHITDELTPPTERGVDISPGEIVIGTVVGFDEKSQPLVDFVGNPLDKPQSAVSTLAIYKHHVGRQAALLFANGDTSQAVIIGLIHNPLYEMLENYTVGTTDEDKPELTAAVDAGVDSVRVDGKKVIIEGENEIVLKCGASSITLTSEGKILIRGKYLLNRSTGINRILGGSVQIN